MFWEKGRASDSQEKGETDWIFVQVDLPKVAKRLDHRDKGLRCKKNLPFSQGLSLPSPTCQVPVPSTPLRFLSKERTGNRRKMPTSVSWIKVLTGHWGVKNVDKWRLCCQGLYMEYETWIQIIAVRSHRSGLTVKYRESGVQQYRGKGLFWFEKTDQADVFHRQ